MSLVDEAINAYLDEEEAKERERQKAENFLNEEIIRRVYRTIGIIITPDMLRPDNLRITGKVFEYEGLEFRVYQDFNRYGNERILALRTPSGWMKVDTITDIGRYLVEYKMLPQEEER